MKGFTVSAIVTVDVVIEIDAHDAATAMDIFNRHIMMNASLVDVPVDQFITVEDSIIKVESLDADEVTP